MPSIGRGLRIAGVTAAIFIVLATLFDTLWVVTEHFAGQDFPGEPGGTTQATGEPLASLQDQQPPFRDHLPARLTMKHCEAAYMHPHTTESFKAHIDRVIDGDTLDTFIDGHPYRVRLWGIDAPESDQPLGPQSKDYLATLARPGTTINIYPVYTDKYGRTVATAGTPGSQAINFNMVSYGMAFQSPWPDAQGNRCLSEATRLALDLSLGVWAPNQKGGIPPWRHRSDP